MSAGIDAGADEGVAIFASAGGSDESCRLEFGLLPLRGRFGIGHDTGSYTEVSA